MLKRIFKSNNLKFFCKENQKDFFGFEKINKSERQSMVNQVFSNVANKYDIMNDLMSFGIHRYWKNYFINEIGILMPNNIYKDGKIIGKEDIFILDVASGTGDIAFKILENQINHNKNIENHLKINLFDINVNMLNEALKRLKDLNYKEEIFNIIEGNAENLETIKDNSVDIYTIVFGIRNVTNIDTALKEAHRVLKKGGRFICMEFSKIQNPILDTIYKTYSFNVIPNLGNLITGDYNSYKYLVESIEKFYSQNEFSSWLVETGFKNVNYTNLSDGIVSIYSGYKL